MLPIICRKVLSSNFSDSCYPSSNPAAHQIYSMCIVHLISVRLKNRFQSWAVNFQWRNKWLFVSPVSFYFGTSCVRKNPLRHSHLLVPNFFRYSSTSLLPPLLYTVFLLVDLPNRKNSIQGVPPSQRGWFSIGVLSHNNMVSVMVS